MSDSVIIDVRGKLCPIPLIELKKALDKISDDGLFEVILDNDTAKDNVFRYLLDANCSPCASRKDKEWRISAKKKAASPDILRTPESYCSPAQQNPVVVFRSDKMGLGDEELGGILMRAFVNTLKELRPLPRTVLLYNSGVFLACGESPSIMALRELEESGAKILVCGTCLDFYGLKPSLKLGTVSNIFDILEALSKANPPIVP